MRRRLRFAIWTAALAIAWLSLPEMLRAQGIGSNMQMPSNLGPIAAPTGRMMGAGKSGRPNPEDPSLTLYDTFVSFIDSAVPINAIGLRFDAGYGNRQPLRASYLFAKGGVPNSVGFPLPEPRVHAQELTSYAEYAVESWFSVFIEAPYRWINPEVNDNQSGAGDVRYGLKLCTWSDDDVLATILLRLYQPAANTATLGTGHWSIEPGLLTAWRITPNLHFEGEARYWIPLTQDDFAGGILRYGIGLSYGQRQASGFWYVPVIEGIGWSVLGGQTMIASSADTFEIQSARNHTIFNGYAGVRLGYAKNVDLYLGYGRALTGHAWARDMFRVEMRFTY